MREYDKVALLFEMLIDTDLASVNRKITEIKMSKEYNRLSEAIVALSTTESMKDVVRRYNKLDIEGILTFERALEVEKEIKELDKRIGFLGNFNPYLVNEDNARQYGIKTVGDVSVEVSANNMKVNDFTTKEGVTTNHRRKIMKIKAFNWYKEAKKAVYLIIENTKLYLTRIRKSKVRFKSLGLEFIILSLLLCASLGLTFFSKNMEAFRLGALNNSMMILGLVSLYTLLISFMFVSIIRVHYRYYGFRMASKMRKNLKYQQQVIRELDECSIKFERDLISQVRKPRKVKTSLVSTGILNEKNNLSFNEVFEYMYSEKEYYYSKHKTVLVLSNIFFMIGVLAAVILISLPLIIAL
ncbi:MAG: hypothetical protein SO253_03775 [Bacilli bacterium]|nr:hypothetical protein [Bacilli bacterium]